MTNKAVGILAGPGMAGRDVEIIQASIRRWNGLGLISILSCLGGAD